MSAVLDAWWKRVPVVTTQERCNECDTLRSGVVKRDYWTPTGKRVHTCCDACAKELSRRYYPPQAYL